MIKQPLQKLSLEQIKYFLSPVATCTNVYDLYRYFTKKIISETLKAKLVVKTF